MDKYEYKVRADEIKALIAEGEFVEAVKIADTIDWRRVKSVMMLCTISDLYKINRRYAESKEILLLAYEKHPTGRLIVYSLCELSIKMEEYVQAIEYYKEFVQIAPKDTGRYILQYRLYEAQDVSLEERIAVLEEFKKRDYREKWAYELAYLYHRIGLSTKCVEECDEMFLWFGEGKYVVKALELKTLHQPLNEDQQEKYDLWMQAKETAGEPYEEDSEEEGYGDDDSEDTGRFDGNGYEEVQEEPAEPEILTTELPEVKTVDLGQYNTINLQMALAESMREILSEEESQTENPEEEIPEEAFEQETIVEDFPVEEIRNAESGYTKGSAEADEAFWEERGTEENLTEYDGQQETEAVYEAAEEMPATYGTEEKIPLSYEAVEETGAVREAEEPATVYEETGEESSEQEYVQETLPVYEEAEEAENAPAIADAEPEESPAAGNVVVETPKSAPVSDKLVDTADAPIEYMEEEEEEPIQEEDPYEPDDDAITKSLIAPLLEETIRMPDHRRVEKKLQEASVARFQKKTAVKEPPKSRKPVLDTDSLQEISAQIVREDTAAFDSQQILEQMKQEVQQKTEVPDADRIPGARTGVLTPLNTKPSKYDNILAQEYDGQISLVMPESERIEKQITGQLSIEDIMAEWEEMKKTNEQKRMEDVRKRILEHTGNLFSDFDEATKNGLLEELERAFVAAIMKESGKKPAIKKVVLPDDLDKKSSVSKRQEIEDTLEADSEELTEEDEIDEAEELEEIEEAAFDEAVEEDIEEEPAAELVTAEDNEAEEEDEDEQESEGFRERELTDEEKELFGEFIHHRKTERQLVHTLDNMSLAPYTGNVLITGEEDETTLDLAKAMIREMQLNDSNFSGKVAKISSVVLNKKDVDETFGRLDNGALIIEKASRLKPTTAAKMVKALDKDNMGLLVLMVDKKQSMNQLLAENTALSSHFNLRVDIEALDDEALVAYAKQYAEEMEYSIDEFGILALHTRIADRQTSDHEVNLAEVRDLVDEAIYHANKKTPGHFMDILLAKRYNEDDMIILREKDFMHY